MKEAAFTNVARLRELLARSSFDAVVASSVENVAYCSGYRGPDLSALKERQYFAVWTANGEPAWVAPSYRDASATFCEDVRHYDFYAREPPSERDTAGYARLDRSPVPALVDSLRDRGLARGRIGVEFKEMRPEHFLQLGRMLPHATFTDCSIFFEVVRMVKTPAEIDLLTRASSAVARAAVATFESARPGEPIKQLTDRLGYLTAHLGARQLRHVEMEVYRDGTRMSVFDSAPGALRLSPGDVLRLDFFGWFDLYLADMARMAVVGRADRAVEDIYRRLYMEVHLPLIQATTGRQTGAQWFSTASRLFTAAVGKVPWGMIAHGIGLGAHERPWCHPLEEFVLEPGMALSVESIFHSEGPMYHIEDFVVIDPKGQPSCITGDVGSAAPVRIW